MFAPEIKGRKDIFALQKLLLKFAGVSLEETQSFLHKLYSLAVLFLMITTPFVQISTAVIFIGDVEVVAEILMYPLFVTTIVVKLGVVLRNRSHLRRLLEKFDSGVFLPKIERGGSVEAVWIENCTASADKLARVCSIGMVITLATLPIVAYSKSLMANDCHDWQYAFGPILNVTCTSYVYPASLYQFVAMSYSGVAYIAIYMLFIAVLMHLRCHFKILKNAIRRAVRNFKTLQLQNVSQMCSSPILQKDLQTSLKKIVFYHVSILDLSHKFKELFSPMLLTLFVADLFLLGYTMNLTSECPQQGLKCIRGILCYLVLIVILFVVSYWGNEINSESQSVAQVCAEAAFVGLDTKFQKCFILMIRRSQKPATFTAGGFIGLSLESFAQVLRGSYSYFMLLYNAKNK